MTNRQKKREEIKKAIAEKYKTPSEIKSYKKYSKAFDAAKAKGYEFKEGATEKYSKEEFRAISDLYSLKAAGLAEVYAAEEAILDEQFQTSSDSISQAVMLWKTWDELVAEEPRMTNSLFRSNESYYFRRLRDMYADDASYDLAMSY